MTALHVAVLVAAAVLIHSLCMALGTVRRRFQELPHDDELTDG